MAMVPKLRPQKFAGMARRGGASGMVRVTAEKEEGRRKKGERRRREREKSSE